MTSRRLQLSWTSDASWFGRSTNATRPEKKTNLLSLASLGPNLVTVLSQDVVDDFLDGTYSTTAE